MLPLEAISATIERNIRELMSFSYGAQSLVQSQNPMGDAVPAAAEGEDEFGQMTGLYGVSCMTAVLCYPLVLSSLVTPPAHVWCSLQVEVLESLARHSL